MAIIQELKERAAELWPTGNFQTKAELARYLKKDMDLNMSSEQIRKYVSKHLNRMDLAGVHRVAKELNVNMDNVSHGWIKSNTGDVRASLFFKNPKEQVSYEDMVESLKDGLKDHSISYPAIDYTNDSDQEEILVMISMADLHLGRHADPSSSNSEFNLEIGLQRAHEAIDAIIRKCQGYNVSKWLWVMGNDVMHVSAGRMGGRSTSSGTLQDVDGHWLDHWKAAIDLNRACIEKLAASAPVHVSLNPSNHDYHESLMLGSAIETIMRNHNGVTFDVTPQHRKYVKFGSTVIGTSHGDKARWNKLGELMLYETQDWNSKEDPVRYRYFFTHHIHSKKALNAVGVIVESCLSLTAGDIWHNDMGYLPTAASLECFGFSKTHGQIFRFTHNLPLERGMDGTINHATLDKNVLG